MSTLYSSYATDPSLSAFNANHSLLMDTGHDNDEPFMSLVTSPINNYLDLDDYEHTGPNYSKEELENIASSPIHLPNHFMSITSREPTRATSTSTHTTYPQPSLASYSQEQDRIAWLRKNLERISKHYPDVHKQLDAHMPKQLRQEIYKL